MEDNEDVKERLEAKDLSTREYITVDVEGGYRKLLQLVIAMGDPEKVVSSYFVRGEWHNQSFWKLIISFEGDFS